MPALWGTSCAKSCERASWTREALASFARAKNMEVATVMLDISKFYERIAHGKLLREAKQVGFPAKLLRIACALYGGFRTVRFGASYSEPFKTKGTIIAGCSLATTLARVLCFRLLQSIGNSFPSVHLNNVVDDFSCHCVATVNHIGREMSGAVLRLADGLDELECRVNLGKVFS